LQADQWAFLAGVQPAERAIVEQLAERLDPFPDAPRRTPTDVRAPAPPKMRGRLDAGITVDRAGVPAWLIADLKHAASLANPDFFEKQRLWFSTWNTPRVIRCYRETLEGLQLPRGLFDTVGGILREAGTELDLTDQRPTPAPVDFEFGGVLRPEQQAAVDARARSGPVAAR
jgi:hypothetical protein